MLIMSDSSAQSSSILFLNQYNYVTNSVTFFRAIIPVTGIGLSCTLNGYIVLGDCGTDLALGSWAETAAALRFSYNRSALSGPSVRCPAI